MTASTTPSRLGVAPARGRVRSVLVAILVFAIGVFCNLPLLNGLFTSLRRPGDIAQGPLVLDQGLTLDNYLYVLSGQRFDFAGYYLNSILLSLGAVVLVLLVAVPAAYGIVRRGVGGSSILRLVAGMRLLPSIFFAVPLFLLFTTIGLYDKVLGLALVNLFLNLPLGLLIIASSIRDLPVEIEEAARVDGCGDWRVLVSIVCPLLAPSMVAVAILTFVFSWADYLFAIVLTSDRAIPVTVGAARFVTSAGIEWGNISAATVLSIIPPLVFAIIARRYLVSGLSVGAVKG